MNLVIDASAGYEFVLGTTAGQALIERLPATDRWWVPELYFVEVAAAIRRTELRGHLSASQADGALLRLQTGKLHRVQLRSLLPEAWQQRQHRTIADAIYVVLATHLNATLVTADERLARSPNLPIPTITPQQP